MVDLIIFKSIPTCFSLSMSDLTDDWSNSTNMEGFKREREREKKKIAVEKIAIRPQRNV